MTALWDKEQAPITEHLRHSDDGFFVKMLQFRDMEKRMRHAERLLREHDKALDDGQDGIISWMNKVDKHLEHAQEADK